MLSSKVRFWLGLKTICAYRGRYVYTRRACGLVRVYFDGTDGCWWTRIFTGSLFASIEGVTKAEQQSKLTPVDG
jgi:hypothetical protein